MATTRVAIGMPIGRGPLLKDSLPAARAGWISIMRSEWLRKQWQPPGARTHSAASIASSIEVHSTLPPGAGWVSVLLLECLRNAVRPPGSTDSLDLCGEPTGRPCLADLHINHNSGTKEMSCRWGRQSCIVSLTPTFASRSPGQGSQHNQRDGMQLGQIGLRQVGRLREHSTHRRDLSLVPPFASRSPGQASQRNRRDDAGVEQTGLHLCRAAFCLAVARASVTEQASQHNQREGMHEGRPGLCGPTR